VTFEETGLPGCYLVRPTRFEDQRGTFAKTFHAPSFAAAGLRVDWREDYYSSSRRGVLRGMHFQTLPAAHAKLVYCVAGAVRDAVLDLRQGSPSFGKHRSFELTEANAVGLYIPSGCAHGFLATSDNAIMYYKVTSVHAPEQDRGLLWDSFGCDWGVADPVVSRRDQRHPHFEGFVSPFGFDAANPSR
jgi:dTDP-4-dehydrorhamnose 3,5-epimerase